MAKKNEYQKAARRQRRLAEKKQKKEAEHRAALINRVLSGTCTASDLEEMGATVKVSLNDGEQLKEGDTITSSSGKEHADVQH